MVEAQKHPALHYKRLPGPSGASTPTSTALSTLDCTSTPNIMLADAVRREHQAIVLLLWRFVGYEGC